MESKQVSQLTTGVMVIVIGLLLLGHQLRLGLDFGRLWPVLLLIIGLSRFASTDEEGRRRNGWWLLLIGGLFLLNNYRILGLGDSWPFFVIGWGIAMMFGRGRRRSRRLPDATATPEPAAADRPWDGRPPS